MKKIFAVAAAASLCAALLAGCGSTATASSAASETISQAASAVSEAVEQANTDLLDSAVAAIEAVNPVNNPRVIDDFSLVNEMGLTADTIVAYKGGNHAWQPVRRVCRQGRQGYRRPHSGQGQLRGDGHFRH